MPAASFTDYDFAPPSPYPAHKRSRGYNGPPSSASSGTTKGLVTMQYQAPVLNANVATSAYMPPSTHRPPITTSIQGTMSQYHQTPAGSYLTSAQVAAQTVSYGQNSNGYPEMTGATMRDNVVPVCVASGSAVPANLTDDIFSGTGYSDDFLRALMADNSQFVSAPATSTGPSTVITPNQTVHSEFKIPPSSATQQVSLHWIILTFCISCLVPLSRFICCFVENGFCRISSSWLLFYF